MPSLLELESRVNLDRDRVGASLTKDTLAAFQKRKFDGEIMPVGVIFSHEFPAHEASPLAQSTARNREAAYGLLRYLADERQRSVTTWLRDAGRCSRFFENCTYARMDRHVVVLPSFNMIQTLATKSMVEELWADPAVLAVVRDLSVADVYDDQVMLLGQAAKEELASKYHDRDNYTWGWSRLRLPEIHQEGRRGKGLRLGIADAWVSDAHPDISGRIVDFTHLQMPGVCQPAHSLDPNGHGTHMAGIMIGKALSGGQIGGAPESELVAACVVRNDRGSFLGALAGIDWLLHPHRRARVINLSFGIREPKDYEELMFDSLIRRAMLLDAVFVAAIGNKAGASCFPARAESVLSAGALDADDTVWKSSGDWPNLVTPGVNIRSCIPSGLPAFHGQSWCLKTGTSPAAAHLSALVGLVMEAVPQASAELVIEALKNTASHHSAPDARFGYGIPDFFDAAHYARQQLAAAG